MNHTTASFDWLILLVRLALCSGIESPAASGASLGAAPPVARDRRRTPKRRLCYIDCFEVRRL